MNKWDEQILVVTRERLFDNEKLVFHGFIPIEHPHAIEIMNRFKYYEIARRGDMEVNDNYKQLISYVVVKDSNNNVLVYTRLSGGGETRLHGKSSVGIGGHMNEILEQSIDNQLVINAVRELVEEIGIDARHAENNLQLIGLINDDTNEVGRVHLGIVYLYQIESALDLHKIEDDTLSINWYTSQQANAIEKYESWSEFLRPIL